MKIALRAVKVASPLIPCSDCEDLRGFNRFKSSPHSNQVASNRPAAEGANRYRCVICNTELIHQTNAMPSRWC